MPAEKDRGAVYAATGERFREEVEVSVCSLKRAMPDLSVTVFCDWDSDVLDGLEGVEVVVFENPEFGYIDKVVGIRQSPYRKTLFIDTDTYISAPLDELFELLDRVDVAAAHELARQHSEFPEIPDCFSEFNSGFVAMNMNDRVLAMLKFWEDRYRVLIDDVGGDQDVFRLACYQSDVSLYVLTPEYNCQVRQVGCVNGQVKVLHGRNIDLERIERVLNADLGKRTFRPSMSRGLRVEPYAEGTMKAWSAFYYIRTRLVDRLVSPFGGLINSIARAFRG